MLVYVIISRPHITPSGIAINGDSYTDNASAKKLVPYLRNLPANTQYTFWTDYGGSSLLDKAAQFLNDQNIKFVPKSENPPNTPVIHCIKNFLGLIKEEVYKDGWEAENLDQLRTRILYCFKRVDQECV